MLRKLFSVVLSAIPLVSFADSHFSQSGHFLQQRALGPIKLQFGLPTAASRLTTPSELQFSLVHSNIFMGGTVEDERLVLDGESSQLSLRFRQRINQCWQFNVDGSVLSHRAGWFDKTLDQWHQFFHLPDAQRDEWPVNDFQYLYSLNGETQSTLAPGTGLGDMQVQLQHTLGCAEQAPIVRYGIKLALGDSKQFFGSGGVDAFVDVQSAWRRSQKFNRVQWAGSVGVLGVGGHDLIAQSQSVVAFGVLGMNVDLNARTQLVAQFDWHSAMFQSGLRELKEPGLALSLGLRYRTRHGGAWELSFAEDAAVDTVPDIVVRLAWVSRFDSGLFSGSE